MKIAIPSTKPNLDGMVENKLGTAAYLMIVETDDMSFEALGGSQGLSGPGAGVQAVSQVVGMGAKVILVGYITPHIAIALEKQGIEIFSQISGSVAEAVTGYVDAKEQYKNNKSVVSEEQWNKAFRAGLRQLKSFLPRLVGVVLLLSLFLGFVPYETLLALFTGSALYDSFWGACIGSVMAGNPVNSYVIGKGLFGAGVGLAGVTALMLAWVSVGVIQLPAESESLGLRFALVRNIAGFVVAIIMSYLMILLVGGLL